MEAGQIHKVGDDNRFFAQVKNLFRQAGMSPRYGGESIQFRQGLSQSRLYLGIAPVGIDIGAVQGTDDRRGCGPQPPAHGGGHKGEWDGIVEVENVQTLSHNTIQDQVEEFLLLSHRPVSMELGWVANWQAVPLQVMQRYTVSSTPTAKGARLGEQMALVPTGC
jgi:hypothetical protein